LSRCGRRPALPCLQVSKRVSPQYARKRRFERQSVARSITTVPSSLLSNFVRLLGSVFSSSLARFWLFWRFSIAILLLLLYLQLHWALDNVQCEERGHRGRCRRRWRSRHTRRGHDMGASSSTHSCVVIQRAAGVHQPLGVRLPLGKRPEAWGVLRALESQ
jgi:hypothetical protein